MVSAWALALNFKLLRKQHLIQRLRFLIRRACLQELIGKTLDFLLELLLLVGVKPDVDDDVAEFLVVVQIA